MKRVFLSINVIKWYLRLFVKPRFSHRFVEDFGRDRFVFMLMVHFGKAIDWIVGNNPDTVQRAAGEFFGSVHGSLPAESTEQINSLFNEWLIFDFYDAAGRSIIKEYYLINPDELSVELLDELRQIIETQFYGYFEVQKIKSEEWVEVWDIFSGKSYRVAEKSLSRSLNDPRVSFFNRLAKVNGIYYFIGSNPIVFPMYYTERAKKDFSSGGPAPKLSPKNLFKILINKAKEKSPAGLYSDEAIESKRAELKKQFTKLIGKYKVTAVFKDLVGFINNESYTSHFADSWLDIQKTGVTEEMVFGETKFFQDLWNYFPHKKLSGISPAEKVREYYGK